MHWAQLYPARASTTGSGWGKVAAWTQACRVCWQGQARWEVGLPSRRGWEPGLALASVQASRPPAWARDWPPARQGAAVGEGRPSWVEALATRSEADRG